MRLRLSDVTGLLDTWYDPAWAEAWDAVGLVCGDPDAAVRADPARGRPGAAVVAEAVEWGADLLVVPPPAVAHARARRRRHHAQGPSWCTLAAAPAARCSPRTPTPTCRPTASPSRWPGPLGLATRRRWSRRRRRRRSTSSCVFVPRGRRRRASGRRSPRRAPARSATTTAASFIDAGEGRFRPLDGRHARRSARSASSRWSTRSGSRSVLPRAAATPGRGRDAGGPPLRGAGVRRPRARRLPVTRPPRGARPDRLGSRRRRRCAAFAEQVSARAAGHRARRARRRRPRPRVRTVAVCGGAGDFLLDDGAAHRRRRLPDLRPAPPPGGGVPGAGRRRPWSTSRTGPPSGPGSRCVRGEAARRGASGAIRWRPG